LHWFKQGMVEISQAVRAEAFDLRDDRIQVLA
jgi:hypothetical protein